MNKKVSTIILSCILLLISVILLIVFLVIPNNVSDAVKPLTIYSQDYNIIVGDKIENFYDVSKNDAVISFEVEDKNIIKIEGTNLIAENPGHTKIIIKASNVDEYTQTTIEINVYLPDYSLKINPVFNCNYLGNNLYCHGEICQFQIEIFDKNNNVMPDVNLKVECEKGYLYQEFLNWTLIINEPCKMVIYVLDINYQFNLNVII
mgnify:CR=1 FL=1